MDELAARRDRRAAPACSSPRSRSRAARSTTCWCSSARRRRRRRRSARALQLQLKAELEGAVKASEVTQAELAGLAGDKRRLLQERAELEGWHAALQGGRANLAAAQGEPEGRLGLGELASERGRALREERRAELERHAAATAAELAGTRGELLCCGAAPSSARPASAALQLRGGELS
jgi:hypothetical protein